MNLYELANELQALLHDLEEQDEPTEATIAQLEEIERDIKRKADGYCSLIKYMENTSMVIELEVDRLRDRAARFTNKARWLKQRLQNALQAIGENKLVTALNTISICKNGGKQPLEIVARYEDLPEQFRKVVYEPNTDAIRTALEAGVNVDGCKLMERGTHLRIK